MRTRASHKDGRRASLEWARNGERRMRSIVGGWSSHRRSWMLLVLATLPAQRAAAQAEVRKLTEPIAVVNTGGHGAPVRALVFAGPDDAHLL